MTQTEFLKQGAVRFEAEWVEKQCVDQDGEWNPDLDKYANSYHFTKESAERAAIASGKKAAQCEWIMVARQKFIGHQWVDQQRWTGDWDGLHEETFNNAEAEER